MRLLQFVLLSFFIFQFATSCLQGRDTRLMDVISRGSTWRKHHRPSYATRPGLQFLTPFTVTKQTSDQPILGWKEVDEVNIVKDFSPYEQTIYPNTSGKCDYTFADFSEQLLALQRISRYESFVYFFIRRNEKYCRSCACKYSLAIYQLMMHFKLVQYPY